MHFFWLSLLPEFDDAVFLFSLLLSNFTKPDFLVKKLSKTGSGDETWLPIFVLFGSLVVPKTTLTNEVY